MPSVIVTAMSSAATRGRRKKSLGLEPDSLWRSSGIAGESSRGADDGTRTYEPALGGDWRVMDDMMDGEEGCAARYEVRITGSTRGEMEVRMVVERDRERSREREREREREAPLFFLSFDRRTRETETNTISSRASLLCLLIKAQGPTPKLLHTCTTSLSPIITLTA